VGKFAQADGLKACVGRPSKNRKLIGLGGAGRREMGILSAFQELLPAGAPLILIEQESGARSGSAGGDPCGPREAWSKRTYLSPQFAAEQAGAEERGAE